MIQKSANTAPADCTMVIFGANGDLTRRLIVPALYNLARSNLLPKHFAILGADRFSDGGEKWRDNLKSFFETLMKAPADAKLWDRLSGSMSQVAGDFSDNQLYERVAATLAEQPQRDKIGGNVLFYLAVPDRFFSVIVEGLARANLLKEDTGWRRVVIEKPFGHDLESARALNAHIRKCLREDQIYRIDHFLGKETVQNIMVLRFANGLFEPIWNRDRIDYVQITVAESIGIETRGKFYEQTGALRDMVPNHLFQLLAMMAMEAPSSFDAEAVRTNREAVFHAIHPLNAQDAVRGQYDEGEVEGKHANAYRTERDVDPHSMVETYIAMRVAIDNWRWAGVPFYLRTGKRLTQRVTEIAVRFKEPPLALFRDTRVEEFGANWLVIRIQPDEGIRLTFNAKRPGQEMALENVALDFKYVDWFNQAPATGYETLLYDCFTGDITLFQREDQVVASWALVDPLLQEWKAVKPRGFPNYRAGTAGPSAADVLIARDSRFWRPIPQGNLDG